MIFCCGHQLFDIHNGVEEMKRPNKTEKKLLYRCLSGDNSAWEVFVDTYQHLLSGAIIHTLKRHGIEPGKPLVEDLFVRVFDTIMDKDCQKFRRFRWKCNLASWLYVIAIRLTVDYLVNQHSQVSVHPKKPGPQRLSTQQINGPQQPDEADIKPEEWQIYKELKTALTPREQLFLKWFYEQKLPAAEIVGMLGISVDEGHRLKDRVREKLKRRIKQLI